MTDDILKGFLSFVIIAGFFYLGFEIVTGSIKTTDQNMLLLIGTVFGAASTYTGTVVSYYFGSTKASGEKDKTIGAMAANIPVVPSTTTVSATKTVETP